MRSISYGMSLRWQGVHRSNVGPCRNVSRTVATCPSDTRQVGTNPAARRAREWVRVNRCGHGNLKFPFRSAAVRRVVRSWSRRLRIGFLSGRSEEGEGRDAETDGLAKLAHEGLPR